jgi:hypothetical protein
VIRLDLAIKRVKETTTFTGNGYFVVDKATLTAMLSTTVTYLVVLVQSPTQTATAGIAVDGGGITNSTSSTA